MKRVRLCEVPECGRQHHCRGYCRMHYTRWFRHGDPRVQLRAHKPKTDGIPHGTPHGYGYWKCRCEACTECARKRSAEWAKKNPNRIRARRLEREYGLKDGQYEAMLAAQDGRCAICGQSPSEGTRYLMVDHNHSTGVVRELLCHLCNVGLGSFHDDAGRLIAAAQYLMRHSTVRVVA